MRSIIPFALFLSVACGALVASAGDANRLAYLDQPCDPYYVNRSFPKLVTPQWLGEEGVDAVIVLSIDDMRGYQRWETFLRPIIDRLKQVDGRAPISIFTCKLDPTEPHHQTWLKEGLSLEVHTLDHPCPCLQGSDFEKASKTYHDCVDLLASVPGSQPVAYRMPCCDSQNTPSPRFWSEIFNQRSAGGNFLKLDSSVFNIITPEDEALPKSLTTDADGHPRFRRYLPFPSFVNTIKDYPYPYVIGKLGWQIPNVVPSDWSAQHVQQPNNPRTVADLQLAIDATVVKQGVYSLVFHPHGWIRNDQINQLVDHAVEKHGGRVKFLNFREIAERLETNLLAGQSLRNEAGRDNGVRIVDLNDDGYVDVVIGNDQMQITRVWQPDAGTWREFDFPLKLVTGGGDRARETGVRFGIFQSNGHASLLIRSEETAGGWHFTADGWQRDDTLLAGLSILGRPIHTARHGRDQGTRLLDLDNDGRCELIAGGPEWQAALGWNADANAWEPLPFALPANTFFVDAAGHDAGLRMVDIDADNHADVLFSNGERWSAHRFVSMKQGWAEGVAALRRDDDRMPPIVRGTSNNGAWFHSDHMWVQNEDTHRMADGVARLSFAKLNEMIDAAADGIGHNDNPRSNGMPAPVPPEKAVATLVTRPGLTVELVAAEPLINDPVAFDWGADGRLWVVEMRDYPNGIDGKGKPGGRVKVLEDADNDGRYDRADLFLDELPFPTGIMAWREGVLITGAPAILYAEDTDGDNRADQVRPLFEGFGKGNQQHRVNGLRWGLDNWLYIANGDSGGRIRSLESGAEAELRSRDLRIKPDSGDLELVSGQTQNGRNRDDFGNWFGGNNSHPAWHYVLDDHYLRRNPHFAPPSVRHEISVTPGAAPVYPLSRTLERFNHPQSANRFTSACSPAIYRDTRLGAEYYGNMLVCEPVHNLVHREVVTPRGATFSSKRASDEAESEFLASTDNWFRPTMVRTGPDGGLWVSDMYRFVIEHPEWIPQRFQAKYDVRAGHDRGRIYRIVPEGSSLTIPKLADLTSTQLISRLNDRNGTVRDMAHRILVWKAQQGDVNALERQAMSGEVGLGRLHSLCVLESMNALRAEVVIDALNDSQPYVRRHAIRVSESLSDMPSELITALATLVDDDDPQVRMQLAYSAGQWDDVKSASVVLARLITGDQYQRAAVASSLNTRNVGLVLAEVAAGDDSAGESLGFLIDQSAAMGAGETLLPALDHLARPSEDSGFEPWQLTTASRLLAHLNGQKVESPVIEKAEAILAPMFRWAKLDLADTHRPEQSRLAALALLRSGSEQHVPMNEALVAMLHSANPPSLQLAALEALAESGDPNSLANLLASWRDHTPALRGELLEVLLAKVDRTEMLLTAIEQKKLLPRHVNAGRRQRLLNHTNAEIARRAASVLGDRPNNDRQKVIDQYAAAIGTKNDATRGKQLFSKHCAACHRLEEVGHHVGPDLTAITNRTPAALLTAMLDPNRAVEDKFLAYSAVTIDGRIHTGMLTAEAGESLTLRSADGKQTTLLRNQLETFRSTEKSFMPEGLEREVDPQQAADLIAYLISLKATNDD